MGTGLGPQWFVPDFPALAARRDPFPDVDRWQATYVRYTLSETAQTKGWDAEYCRRNLQDLGFNDHPLLRQSNLPESINMRIIEAPAEFALPVKQDRRLLPCFKVRLELQHRGAVSMPVTLRAHVLSQQDKEQISGWVPPDEASARDDKSQKAATELKGTSVIRCTLEAGASGEVRTVGVGGKDGTTLPSSGSGSAGTNGSGSNSSVARSGSDRVVKSEPSYGFNGGPAGPVMGMGLGGGSNGTSGSQRGTPQLGQDGHGLDAFSLHDPISNLGGSNRPQRDGGAAGLLRDLSGPPAPQRDVNFGALFAANRPDPVVTLASSCRMSGTGSNLAGLGGGQPGRGLLGPAGGVGGLRLNPGGEPRDAFDAAVEMLMQPSGQATAQQRRQNGLLDVNVGGSKLISDMQRQLQQQQEERQQHDRASSVSSLNATGGQMGKLHTSCQDFEFTNLEFLKPTRMNKVYMAFTVSILDTDLLYVVFNVPTIGICRAEQREKACKKLHIDYRLLSHFDQGSDRPQASSGASGSPSLLGLASVGSEGPGMPGQGNGPGPGHGQGPGHLSMTRLTQSKMPSQHAQQQAQQMQQAQQQQMQLQDVKFSPQAQPGQGSLGLGPQGIKYGQQVSDVKIQQLANTDYPRMLSGINLQPHQHPQQQQQRLGDGGLPAGLMSPGGGYGAAGLAGGAGMLGPGSLSPGGPVGNGMGNGNGLGGMGGNGMQSGMMVGGNGMGNGAMGNGGMAGNGMGNGGMAVGAGMGGRMGPGIAYGFSNGSLAPELGGAGSDFFFGTSAAAAANGANGGAGGVANGGGLGGMSMGAMGPSGASAMELGGVMGMNGNSRKRDQGQKEDDNYRFQPVQTTVELPPYQGFMGLTSSDVEMLLPAPHSRMAMRDFINEVYDGTGLHRKLTHMDIQALLSQAGFPMDSNREHDTISPQQWDEFCSQYKNIVNTLQQVASVWNMEDPVVISGFDMDRAGTITALANEPAGTFVCRFSMSQPGCLVLTCKVGTIHPRADPMGLIHAIIKIDDLHERRVDTWIRDYAGATHLLDVYRQKRVDKRKVFATNYTRLRGLEVGEPSPLGLGPGFM